jgi:curved DNA-binding protein CbpA
VLHLLPSAPPELIEGAYKILARLSHPDVGGDPEAMRALNEARDALKELAVV